MSCTVSSNRGAVRRSISLLAALFLCLSAGIPPAAPPKGPVPRTEAVRRIRAEFTDSVFKRSPVGVWIESLDTGEILYRQNPSLPFAPASNLKVLTTAAAVSMLGPDFRYETDLLYTGTVDGNTLRGDLIIRGSGDPSLGDTSRTGGRVAAFDSWVWALGDLGVEIVDGDIIGDDDVFSDELLAKGWKPDQLIFAYSAQSCGLSFGENCIELAAAPGNRVGGKASVTAEPPTSYVSITNQTKTAPADKSRPTIRIERPDGGNELEVMGSIGARSRPYKTQVTIHNPCLYTATLFRESLERSGIRVRGSARDIDEFDDKLALRHDLKPVASSISPALQTFLPVINKDSHNFYANQVFRTLGHRAFEIGGWVRSASAVESFLLSIDEDPAGLAMADGCGLSPLNRATPAHLAAALRHMWRHPAREVYLKSLAVMGKDGTLRRRLRGTRAEGNVFAKTGYIKGVRALSGYLRTDSGEWIAFSFLIRNAEGASGAFHESVDDSLLTLLVME